jgi:CheY-like chemotaxis protein
MSARQQGKGELILMIDDEPTIGLLARVALTRAGYRVLAAASGEEGLALFRGNAREVRLVIVDLLMPGMSGVECIDRLRALDRTVRLVVTSAVAEADLVRDLLATGIRGFVQKPFDVSRLLAVVRDALAG